jgi:hypothetical protein
MSKMARNVHALGILSYASFILTAFLVIAGIFSRWGLLLEVSILTFVLWLIFTGSRAWLIHVARTLAED